MPKYDKRNPRVGRSTQVISGLRIGRSPERDVVRGCAARMTPWRAPEKYLKPEVIRQVSRLDLRAKFIVEGFISGLHASPFQGFSVEFSEHRKYTSGDNISDIDWNVYAKTDRYYIKKFQAETNLTGYLVMDLSGVDGLHLPPGDHEIRVWHQPCGGAQLLDDSPARPGRAWSPSTSKVSQSLAPASKRSQLGNILALLANSQPTGKTEIAKSLHQVAGMLRHRSLVMLFSDLLGDFEPIQKALHRLRFAGHDVIVFHILDEAEALFPFEGMLELEDNETHETLLVDAEGIKADYLEEVAAFQSRTGRNAGGADRLHPASHGDAVRQGPDELSAQPTVARLRS